MILQQPIWLILILPLAAAWFLWRLPSPFLRALRAVIFVLLVLALCRLAVRGPGRGGLTVVLADRSASMPADTDVAQKEIVDRIQSAIPGGDRMAVVSFGRRALVEHSPQAGKFAGFLVDAGRDQSDLHGALETAFALVGKETGGRILVLSDGRWTGRDPLEAAARFAARGLAIDYRLLQRPAVNDLSLTSLQAPDTVLPGQAFMLGAVLHAPVGQEITFEFKRGTQVLAAGKRTVASGTSRLTFRDRAPESGTCAYTVSLKGPAADPVPENNTARVLVGIRALKPVLVVSPAGAGSRLAQAIQAAGIRVKAAEAGQCRWNLDDLSQVAAVVLENVPANDIGTGSMETLAAWVEHAGGGLMMTGGRNAYGPGGYFKSPLETIMPVSMELRREHRKLSLAIVVALDRSGSMAMPAGGGRCKMDLANLGTVQVLDLLSAMDEFGAVAVDSSPHVVVELDTVERNHSLRGQILRIDSMGGGIFIYEALSTATKMIMPAKAGTRHIILFADAADSEEPGRYKELLEQARKANITVSVIGLGLPGDCDAELLRDIARRGGGECFFTVNPEEIPRLFAQDTFTVARSTFVEEPTPVKLTAGLRILMETPFDAPPAVGGYNLCYGRPGADFAAVTVDDYKAPLVASWHSGSGRTLCFTGEADGKFTGAFGQWAGASKFLAGLAGWTAGRTGVLPDNLLITQDVRDGLYTLEIHLDPERKSDPFTGTPRLKLLRGEPGLKPSVESLTPAWKSSDLLAANVMLSGNETLLAAVEIPGHDVITLAPVCLPYSPEFKPDREGKGRLALAQLAAVTGGKERVDLAGIWKDLPRTTRYYDLMPVLVILAALGFLVEIFERRTGLIYLKRQSPVVAGEEPETGAWGKKLLARIRPAKAAPPATTPADAPGPPSPAPPAEKETKTQPESATLSALRQARRKASERLSGD